MNEPTHLDLFSGIGGFAIAAARAGFRTIAFCEIEPYPQAILKARFGAVEDSKSERQREKGKEKPAASDRPRLHRDIRKLDGRLYAGVSLVTGGFPCQPFSLAGKRAGTADDRFLWPEMLRIVSEARPAWLVGENVAGIISMELDHCLSDLENIGYAVWPLVIPACAVDARHRRDRVWIVANGLGARLEKRKEQPAREEFPATERGGNTFSDTGQRAGFRSKSRPSLGTVSIRNGQGWCEWLPEPDVGRVAHGVSARVDRLKALGNAIVPAQAYPILKAIQKAMTTPH